ncbi:MAG: glycoside hydrolase family 68 protein [Zymomonas mobilis subsp. pomaceae]|uniref:glycoside hydrolase family 68 protein n=1 Tax=Zymomonas mobilis TaxID=542 RepID=UPI0039ECD72F
MFNFNASRWTRAQAMKINKQDKTTMMPEIGTDFPIMRDDLWLWDTWPLRDINGNVVSFKGWTVIFSLVADRKIAWNNRHSHARIGYFYSKDGKSWIYGGHLLNETANTRTAEWSGGTIMAPGSRNQVETFFTSTLFNESGIAEAVAAVTKGHIYADNKGVWFSGFDQSTDMFQADGLFYANYTENNLWNFRDPHVFINPEDGETYALFEGNVAMVRGQSTVGEEEIGFVPENTAVAEDSCLCSASIGIAHCLSDDRTEWELLPPLVTAFGVNDQTERPHVIFQNGLTYLFTITHNSTFADGLTGSDGLYGFVSENGIFGPYEPLNGSGLVLGGTPSQPTESYAHYMMNNGLVESFISEVIDPKTGKIIAGGTLAPTVQVELQGHETFATEVKAYGYIQADYAWPVRSIPDRRPSIR